MTKRLLYTIQDDTYKRMKIWIDLTNAARRQEGEPPLNDSQVVDNAILEFLEKHGG